MFISFVGEEGMKERTLYVRPLGEEGGIQMTSRHLFAFGGKAFDNIGSRHPSGSLLPNSRAFLANTYRV
jgi:hypothetical protein